MDSHKIVCILSIAVVLTITVVVIAKMTEKNESDNVLKAGKTEWRYAFEKCVNSSCGDICIDKCRAGESVDDIAECYKQCQKCQRNCCMSAKMCNQYEDDSEYKDACIKSCKMF